MESTELDWYALGVLLVQLLAAVGAWAHINPWMKNASNNAWINRLLALGKGFAGEYKYNRSAD